MWHQNYTTIQAGLVSTDCHTVSAWMCIETLECSTLSVLVEEFHLAETNQSAAQGLIGECAGRS